MTPRRAGASARPTPTTEAERAIAAALGGSATVVGIDEVGRGAIAGPVVVGACALRIEDGRVTTPLPEGVRDSKALTARRREALVDPIREAAPGTALGWASAAEIDAHGILAALTLAAVRAVDALEVPVDAVLLDGNVDVLGAHLMPGADGGVPAVTLRVGADRDCVSVAAASVLAKVARDAHMVALADEAPVYGWASNKGYGAAAHRDALARVGAHSEHRRSWNLGTPGTAGGAVPAPGAVTPPEATVTAAVEATPGAGGTSDAGVTSVTAAAGPSADEGADVLWTDDMTGRHDRIVDGQQEDPR